MSKQTVTIHTLEALMDGMWEEWDFQMLHLDIAIVRERCQRAYNTRYPIEMATYIANLNK